MFKHLTIAFRFLFKNREYALINIGGLCLSLVAVFLITLYLVDELNFDRMHTKKDRIYRVIEHQPSEQGEESDLAGVAFRASTVEDEIAAIEVATPITHFGRANISNDENSDLFYEELYYGQQDFFKVFDFKVVYGNRDQLLTKPFTAVFTRSTAIKIFGTADVVGKNFHSDRDDQPFTISGVIEDFPSSSHLSLNILFSMESLLSTERFQQVQTSDWSSNYFSIYYLLKPDADPKKAEVAVTDLVKNNRTETTSPFYFWLQPLTDIHFYSSEIRGGYGSRSGNIYYVYIFAAIGLFILVIALVNYVNLSTALSSIRGKEIGVKKVAGATKGHLVTQFIMESTLVVFIAVGLAIVIVTTLLPFFNSFTGKSISAQLISQPTSLVVLAVFTLFIGFLSGSYPAFYLSRLQPIKIMKGFSKGSRSSWIRSGLVVFQFTLFDFLFIIKKYLLARVEPAP